MKKILVPIDGTERSKKSLDFILNQFCKDDVEITLISIGNISFANLSNPVVIDMKVKEVREKYSDILDKFENLLPEYRVSKYFSFGDPGQEIITKSIEGDFDCIVMTKSTKKNFIDSIGSVTLYVVKKSKCTVVIVPENNQSL